MNEMDIIIDFHKDALRQGPGDDKETIHALSFIGNLNQSSKIIDIGCGTGAQTIALAKNTIAQITAVDFLPDFIEQLDKKIKTNNLEKRIKTEVGSMFDLSHTNEFDLIWAEGSIYNIGFSKGFQEWRKSLKTGGYIAVTEISWLTQERPLEIEKYWTERYSEIDTVSNKVESIKSNGYIPITTFTLPQYCWIENYYRPIMDRMETFLQKHSYNEDVVKFIESEKQEYAMFEKYKDYYSYVFYIAKKHN